MYVLYKKTTVLPSKNKQSDYPYQGVESYPTELQSSTILTNYIYC